MVECVISCSSLPSPLRKTDVILCILTVNNKSEGALSHTFSSFPVASVHVHTAYY